MLQLFAESALLELAYVLELREADGYHAQRLGLSL